MEITITASKEFKEELLQHKELYSHISVGDAENNSEYNSFFSADGITFFEIVINIGTSLVAGLIMNYLQNHPKEGMVVNTGEEQYILNSSNINNRYQILQNELDSGLIQK